MSGNLDGFVSVDYQGIVNVHGESANIPVIMLKDHLERTIAVPLERLEAELIQRALGSSQRWPQPYHSLVSCINKLDAKVFAVCIHHSSEFDLPTTLILQNKTGQEVEIDVACSEGIACAHIADAPIYVSEMLMKVVGASPIIS